MTGLQWFTAPRSAPRRVLLILLLVGLVALAMFAEGVHGAILSVGDTIHCGIDHPQQLSDHLSVIESVEKVEK